MIKSSPRNGTKGFKSAITTILKEKELIFGSSNKKCNLFKITLLKVIQDNAVVNNDCGKPLHKLLELGKINWVKKIRQIAELNNIVILLLKFLRVQRK